MNVQQIVVRASNRYPWTHRIGFDDADRARSIFEWTESNNISGLWANNAFYTSKEAVSLMLLAWS
jgi:hypothetical protein